MKKATTPEPDDCEDFSEKKLKEAGRKLVFW